MITTWPLSQVGGPLNRQASGLVSGGGIVPFFVIPSMLVNVTTIINDAAWRGRTKASSYAAPRAQIVIYVLFLAVLLGGALGTAGRPGWAPGSRRA